MKGFTREETRFSLCGLNCCLYSMHLGGYCHGCGGGAGNQSCAIAKCSLEHGGVQFCRGARSTPVPTTTVSTTGTPLCPTGTGGRTSPWPGRLGWKPTLPGWRKSERLWRNFWPITMTAAARCFSILRSTCFLWRICAP